MGGGRQCQHCKQWIADDEPHDCWTTTEAALTRDLSEDLRDAYDRIRETLSGFGEQRIYASHHSIMFSRRACYCFVRPRRSYLELVIFLGRSIASPHVVRSMPASRVKIANVVRLRHRDEVEAPITEWMREAYAFAGEPARPASRPAGPRPRADSIRSRAPASPNRGRGPAAKQR